MGSEIVIGWLKRLKIDPPGGDLLHVRCQRSFLQEFPTADRARVRDTSVKLAVIDELEFSGERGAAVSASERIHRSMESRVHVQVLLLREALAAILRFKNVR